MMNRYLRETAVLLVKAACTSGSSSIMRLPFSATFSLRSTICSFTQPLKVSPKMEYATLAIHCFGSRMISDLSG